MSRTTAETIVTLLEGHRFTQTCEEDLQRGVQEVLEENGLPYVREASLSPGERPDFLVIEGVLDPAGELVTKLTVDPEHIKKLAAAYLKGRK